MCKTKPTPCKTALALAAREEELIDLRTALNFQKECLEGAILINKPIEPSSQIFMLSKIKAALNEQI